MKKDQIALQWDWKAQADLSDFKKLEALGVFVYEDPALDGSDSCGFIFSKTELTPAEVEAVSKKLNSQ